MNCIIVAYASNRVIGKDNKMPWYLPADLKRFRKITTGHSVIMGRKTFESMNRPLPDRENIIITRNPEYKKEKSIVCHSLEEALSSASSEVKFILGGAEIYRLAFEKNLVDMIYATEIAREYEGDAYFPDFDKGLFVEEIIETSYDKGIDSKFSYVNYTRS